MKEIDLNFSKFLNNLHNKWTYDILNQGDDEALWGSFILKASVSSVKDAQSAVETPKRR
jgi:hypothetical protein